VTDVQPRFAIGCALLGGEIDAKTAEAAARIEESANIDRWGLVEGAHDYDLARIQVQLASAAFFAAASLAP
jgi:ATP synthase F1 complex assembly factor 2